MQLGRGLSLPQDAQVAANDVQLGTVQLTSHSKLIAAYQDSHGQLQLASVQDTDAAAKRVYRERSHFPTW